MKSYTDIEQSKKLAEILPPESADMCYKCLGEDPYDIVMRPYTDWKEEYKGLLVNYEVDVIPCWSLVALLSLIPKRINNYNVLRIDISVNDFAIWYDEIGFGVNDELPNITKEFAVDACYELILKLNEQNIL